LKRKVPVYLTINIKPSSTKEEGLVQGVSDGDI